MIELQCGCRRLRRLGGCVRGSWCPHPSGRHMNAVVPCRRLWARFQQVSGQTEATRWADPRLQTRDEWTLHCWPQPVAAGSQTLVLIVFAWRRFRYWTTENHQHSMMEARPTALLTLGNDTRDYVRHATAPAPAARLMPLGAVKIEWLSIS